ncbi:MAG: hypothetical protein HMLIMOIP_002055 [Candidatus Nitrosomirales archaeon]|jgi:hypothetical protein
MRPYWCTQHLGKVIFYTEEEADKHIRVYYWGRNFQIYPCPEVLGHFHIRNKTKRNYKKEKNKARNKAKNRGESQ